MVIIIDSFSGTITDKNALTQARDTSTPQFLHNPVVLVGANGRVISSTLDASGNNLLRTDTTIASITVDLDAGDDTVQVFGQQIGGSLSPIIVDTSGRMVLAATSTVILSTTSTVVLSTTSTVNLNTNSTVQLGAGSTVSLNTNSTVQLSTTSTVNLNANSTIILGTTSTVSLNTNSTVQLGAGSTVSLNTNSTVQLSTTSTLQATFSSTLDARLVTSAADTTSSAFIVGTGAGTILAATAARIYAGFRLIAGGTITLRPVNVPVSLNGIVLYNIGDAFNLDATNMNRGVIQAISTAANSTLSVSEW